MTSDEQKQNGHYLMESELLALGVSQNLIYITFDLVAPTSPSWRAETAERGGAGWPPSGLPSLGPKLFQA